MKSQSCATRARRASVLVGALAFTLAAQLLVLAAHYATGLFRVVPLAQTVAYLTDPPLLQTGPALPALFLALGAGFLAGSVAWALSRGAALRVQACSLGGLGFAGGTAAALLAICCSPAMGKLIGSSAGGVVLLAYQARSLLFAGAMALLAAGILGTVRAARRAGRRVELPLPATAAGSSVQPLVALMAANVIALAALLITAARPAGSAGAPAPAAPPLAPGAMLVHVQDVHRRPLPGAVVVVTGPASAAGTTTMSGTLPLADLPPGSYLVVASMNGTTTELHVEVEAGRTAHAFLLLGP